MMKLQKNNMKIALFVFLCIAMFLGIKAETDVNRVHVEYLKSTIWLDFENYTDNYFSCNAVGQYIHWEVNGEALVGFQKGEIAHAIADARQTFNYIATLLVSAPHGNFSILSSVLIVSWEGSGHLNVTCLSDLGYNKTSNDINPMNVLKQNHTSDAIVFERVLSKNILRNITSNITHIFICGTPSQSQFLEVNQSQIGFSNGDQIGQNRSVISPNGAVVIQQAVLGSRRNSMTSTVLFVTSNDSFTVSCWFNGQQSKTITVTSDSIAKSNINTAEGNENVTNKSSNTDLTLLHTSEEISSTSSVRCSATLIIGLCVLAVVLTLMEAELSNDRISCYSSNITMHIKETKNECIENNEDLRRITNNKINISQSKIEGEVFVKKRLMNKDANGEDSEEELPQNNEKVSVLQNEGKAGEDVKSIFREVQNENKKPAEEINNLSQEAEELEREILMYALPEHGRGKKHQVTTTLVRDNTTEGSFYHERPDEMLWKENKAQEMLEKGHSQKKMEHKQYPIQETLEEETKYSRFGWKKRKVILFGRMNFLFYVQVIIIMDEWCLAGIRYMENYLQLLVNYF